MSGRVMKANTFNLPTLLTLSGEQVNINIPFNGKLGIYISNLLLLDMSCQKMSIANIVPQKDECLLVFSYQKEDYYYLGLSID